MFRTLLSATFLFIAAVASASEAVPADTEKIALVADGTLTEAFASWWGFDENDATDSLQKALVSGVKKLTVDKMPSDWVVRPLTVPSDIEITLADNVTIRAKPGAFLGPADSLLTISRQENVTIRGGKNAVLAMRKSDYHAEPYKLAEWRHGLNIKSAKNIRVENLTIRDTGGDGIYLGVSKRGVPCEDIVIKNVRCDANNRQGISVISAKNLTIKDCELSNTDGTAPEAGIDFEPNRDNECLVNCVMRRCVLNNNSGAGIALYLPIFKRSSGPISLTFEDCSTTGNRRDGFWLHVGNGPENGLAGEILVKNCRFVSDGGGVRVVGKGADDHALIFENTRIDLTPGEGKTANGKAPITIINHQTDETPAGGIEFRNVTVIDPVGTKPISYTDTSSFDFAPEKLSGTLTVKGSADAQGETVTIDPVWQDRNFPKMNRRAIVRQKLDNAKIVPLNTSVPAEEKPSVLRPRNKATWLLYGTKGEAMTFSLSVGQIGRSKIADVAPILRSPSGKETTLEKIVDGKRVDYTIDADETGVWRLSAEATPHALALSNVSVPNALDATRSAALISTVGTFYFYVAPGTPNFGVKLTASDAERVTATIFAPDGSQAERYENVQSAVFYDSGDQFAPGVWSIRLEKPTVGVLEDFSVTLYGVLPLLTNERRFILTDKE